MTQIALATGLIIVLILTLSLIVIAVRAILSPSRPVAVTVNGNTSVEGITGSRLLSLLNAGGIAVPSACAGAGTCGQCKIRVKQGGGDPLPTETAILSRADIRDGQRLSCQLVVRGPLSVEVPDDMLSAERWTSVVVSTTQVAPLIRELVLSVPEDAEFSFRAGSYAQVSAPAYELDLAGISVDPAFDAVWAEMGIPRMRVHNAEPTHRAYSIASRPEDRGTIVLNIRLALPPVGASDVPPGIVSSYLFSLKPGDTVDASGPFGEFHVQDTDREMVFIGGGVGMAPLRAMIHEQLGLGTMRKISFWYGARSGQDIFYREEFETLAETHPNFSWTLALSEPQPEDNWNGPSGFIHEVVNGHLRDHKAPQDCEYYLCGPPLMISAVFAMLDENGVEPTSIFNDDFGV